MTANKESAVFAAAILGRPVRYYDGIWPVYAVPVQELFKRNQKAGIRLAREFGLVFFLPLHVQVKLALLAVPGRVWAALLRGLGAKS